jgi:hypothetical protein
VDSGGNVFVASSCRNSTNADVGVIKYSNSGVPLWTNCYNGPADRDDIAAAIAVDGNGNVFVAAKYQTDPTPWRYWNYVTVGYSSSGTLLWANAYEAHNRYGDSTPVRLAVDSSGNVFLSVSSWSGDDPTTSDYATIAYSNAGDLLWINYYDGPGNNFDVPHALAVDNTGNVFVTGESVGIGGFWSDYATIAYSNAGVPLWTNRYGNGFAHSFARAVACDRSGNVFVTGASYSSSGTGDSDYATVKYSSSGVPLWTRRYSGSARLDESANAIAVDSSGNVFVTGESGRDTSNASDMTTLAYSSSGVPLWTNRWRGPDNGFNSGRAIAVDPKGNVFVAGSAGDNTTNYHALTIKYSSSLPPPVQLDFQLLNNQLVLNWTNAGFNLQSAPFVTGPFTNLPAATSPYTNPLTAPQQFFRLEGNWPSLAPGARLYQRPVAAPWQPAARGQAQGVLGFGGAAAGRGPHSGGASFGVHPSGCPDHGTS